MQRRSRRRDTERHRTMLDDLDRGELTIDLLHDPVPKNSFTHQFTQEHVLQRRLFEAVRLCHRQDFVAEVALMK